MFVESRGVEREVGFVTVGFAGESFFVDEDSHFSQFEGEVVGFLLRQVVQSQQLRVAPRHLQLLQNLSLLLPLQRLSAPSTSHTPELLIGLGFEDG